MSTLLPNDRGMPSGDVGHPAPHRGRLSLLILGIGVFGAPAAWILQMLLSYVLASHSCYPEWTPRETPLWDWLWPALGAIAALTLVGAAVSGFVARNSWRTTRTEQRGSHRHLLDVGEGRTRFLAMCGIMMSVGFFVLLVFTTMTLLIVPACPR